MSDFTTTHIVDEDTTLLPYHEYIKTNRIERSTEEGVIATPILCTFSEKVLAESPHLVIYCVIIGLIWLIFMLTICFGQVRKLIDKIFTYKDTKTNNNIELFTITDEHKGNRRDPLLKSNL
jgi:hypothetical protein